MSSNKMKKKTSTAHGSGRTSPMKSTLVSGFWIAVIGVGVWALMEYSAPSNNLKPYNPNQIAKAKTGETGQNEFETSNFDTGNKGEISDLVKNVANANSASPLPRETLELIQKGMELTEQGKENQANIEFEKAAEISPNSPELYSIWGTALKMQKKYKGANKKFAIAHDLAPTDKEIIFNWGMSLLDEGNSLKAIEVLKKTVEMDPQNFLAFNALGKAYGQKKMYALEEESYRKSIAINPNFGWTHFYLGVVLSLQKRFEEAADPFERAIEIDKQFEKPFVVQLLTAVGRHNPSAMKPAKEEKPPEPVKTAKLDTQEPKTEQKKAEGSGSDHKMEGSKNAKETTTLTGKALINGKAIGANAVVFLETKSKLPVPNQQTGEARIVQNELAFQPMHTVISAGTTVTFVNLDKEVHNIYSKSIRNQFNLGAMAAGSGKSMKFTQAGPVVLRCNLHKDMVGTLFVVPNGYYTQPDAEGNYKFENVKSQGYLVQFWHPEMEPNLVDENMKQADLTGIDQTFDFDVKSNSLPGEIHDMVDPTDYNAIVDRIEKEIIQAVADWKAGKRSIPTKRMLMAITKHYDGEGLKGAIAKSFSEKRSLGLEKKLDDMRKQISGIGVKREDVSEKALLSQANFIVSQLRLTVKELEARLNPE
jgi:Tfp pilus assembly protein PilF/plastocyanin